MLKYLRLLSSFLHGNKLMKKKLVFGMHKVVKVIGFRTYTSRFSIGSMTYKSLKHDFLTRLTTKT